MQGEAIGGCNRGRDRSRMHRTYARTYVLRTYVFFAAGKDSQGDAIQAPGACRTYGAAVAVSQMLGVGARGWKKVLPPPHCRARASARPCARACRLHVPPPLRARGRALRARAAPRKDVALTLRACARAASPFPCGPSRKQHLWAQVAPRTRTRARRCKRTDVRAYVRTYARAP